MHYTQRMKRGVAKLLTLTSLLMIFALIVAACGGDDPTPTPVPPAATATPVPEAAPAATPVPKAKATPTPKPKAAPKAAPKPAPTAVPKPPPAPSVMDFKGKTVRITVGYAPGGGFDTYARVFAVHLKDALKGKPNVIISNLPGASTLIAAKSAVNRPVRDNQVDIVLVINTLLINTVLGGVEGFSPTDLTYLGSPDFAPSDNTWCVRTSVTDSIDGVLKAGRDFTLAQIGHIDSYGLHSQWLKDRGMPFTLVYNYSGTSDMNAAFNRKEVEITPTCRQSEVENNPEWNQGFATPLFYVSKEPAWVTEGKAAGKWPWATTFTDFAKAKLNASADELAAIQAIVDTSQSTRVFAMPASTPDNVVSALRVAFSDVIESEAFIADMKKRKYDVGLLTGSALQASIESLNNLPPASLAIVKDLFAAK